MSSSSIFQSIASLFVRFCPPPFYVFFFILYLFRERKKESNRNYAGSREEGGLSVKYLGCRARWHKFRTRCKIVLVKLACPQKEESRKIEKFWVNSIQGRRRRITHVWHFHDVYSLRVVEHVKWNGRRNS